MIFKELITIICKLYKSVIFFLCVISSVNIFSQTKINFNGGFVNISNKAYLVIDNQQTNAITRTTGGIISEGEDNVLKWLIKNNTGNYLIPWHYNSSNYIPLQLSIISAGSSDGYINFSTYRTPNWQNSSWLPFGVTNFSSLFGGGSDGSKYAVDRFWGIDAMSYTSKPSLNNLIFTYVDAGTGSPEISGGSNTIVETNLQAQRWNSTINDWEGNIWAHGTDNPSQNNVSVAVVNNNDLYRWWTLVDKLIVLPIELISFDATCTNNVIQLNWKTTSEQNNKGFIIEKSTNGVQFDSLIYIPSKSAIYNNQYQYFDNTSMFYSITQYYRLVQIDNNDKKTTYNTIDVNSCNDNIVPAISAYFNGNSIIITGIVEEINYNVILTDVSGKLIFETNFKVPNTNIEIKPNYNLSNGLYYLTFYNSKKTETKKLLINN